MSPADIEVKSRSSYLQAKVLNNSLEVLSAVGSFKQLHDKSQEQVPVAYKANNVDCLPKA